MKIDAPWDVKNTELKTYMDMIRFFKKQLLYFQKKRDTEHLRNDLKGYDIVLDSNNEENAKNFINIKREYKKKENLKNNLKVIEYMKNKNIWVD